MCNKYYFVETNLYAFVQILYVCVCVSGLHNLYCGLLLKV